MNEEDNEAGPTDGHSLPKTHLQKLIRQHTASELRISSDLADLVSDCCVEFVRMVSTAANERSTEEKKATLTPEHVIAALKELEFVYMGPYMEEFMKELNAKKVADSQAKAKRKTGAEKCGMSEEEQIAMQKKLFEQARAQAAGQDIA